MDFLQDIKIHFSDADPAGICFFAQVFTKIHGVYESFISAIEIDEKEWFLDPKIVVPIRHTEANFLKPLMAMETYTVQVNPISISESSFRLLFVIGKNGMNHCNIITTHTCFDPIKKVKRLLPQIVREKMSQRLIQFDSI